MNNDETLNNTIERLLNGDNRSIETDESPLQLPSQDRILRHYTLGGTETNRDIRMYLSLGDLLKLVEIAKKSDSNRVVLPKAGITLTVRQSHQGHVYETLHVTSKEPVPEIVPKGIEMPTTNNLVDQWTRKGLIK